MNRISIPLRIFDFIQFSTAIISEELILIIYKK